MKLLHISTMVFLSMVVGLASCASTVKATLEEEKSPSEMKGEVRRTEKEVPGIRFIHAARIAYAKYRDLVHKQESQKSLIARQEDSYLPDEHMEKLKAKYLDEAEKNLRRVIEINPDSAMSHQVLGLIHLDRDEHDEAVEEFREVLRIDPLAENAWVNIAHVCWKRGDGAGAKEALGEAFKLNPTNKPALLLKAVIENAGKKQPEKKPGSEVPPFRPKLDR